MIIAHECQPRANLLNSVDGGRGALLGGLVEEPLVEDVPFDGVPEAPGAGDFARPLDLDGCT